MKNKKYELKLSICRFFSGLDFWLKRQHRLLWSFCGLLILLSFAGLIYFTWNEGPFKSMIRLTSSVPAFETIDKNKCWILCILELAVYFAGLIIVIGIILPVMTNTIRTIGDQFKNGEIHFHFSDHIVILGGQDISFNLIKQLRKKDQDTWIEIQTSDNARRLNQRLKMSLDDNELKRVVVIQGARDSKEDLENLCIQNAKGVYILGEEGESSKDITNLNCIKKINDICKEKNRNEKICCNMLFENQTTFSILHFANELPDIKEKIELRAFNFYDDWAVNVLGAKRFCKRTGNEAGYYCPLDRESITKDSEKGVHFVIVGANRIGFAMAANAAHIAHYPNFVTCGIKTKITIIDPNVEEEMLFFKGKYAHLFDLSAWQYRENNGEEWETKIKHTPQKDFLDIEWAFFKGAVQSDEVRKLLSEYCNDEKRLVTLAVCLENSPRSLAAGLYLPDVVYAKKIPVLFYQEKSGLLLETASKSDHYREIRPFGMASEYWIDWEKKVRMAQRVNYVYDHISEIPVKFPESELKENWNNRSIVDQWSNIYNANTIYTKLRSVGIDVDKPNRGLTSEEVELLAKVEHNRWNVEKLMMGFRPTTDEENREIKKNSGLADEYKKKFIHHAICPYENVPDDLKKYDIGLTKALLAIAKG